MNRLLVIVLTVFLSGCASGYSKFYKQNTNVNVSKLVTLKEGQIPVIVRTNDLERETDLYWSKNYFTIGVSSFNGSMETDENIISQAIDVKATHVIQGSKFVTTQGVSTPLVMPNGFGGLNVTPMYNQHMRYNQTAVFMAKGTEKPRIGLWCTDLTPDQRKQYERNSGVIVRLVYEESPAFDANIVTGDLIVDVNGNSVRGEEHFYQLLKAIPQSADKVIFKVIRNNTEKDIDVKLDKSLF